jgi:hypothetical protein
MTDVIGRLGSETWVEKAFERCRFALGEAATSADRMALVRSLAREVQKWTKN